MKKFLLALLLCAAPSYFSACGDKYPPGGAPSSAGSSSPAETSQTPVASSRQNLPKIVAFGDSLTAGYGLSPAQSYPSLLQKKLDADGYKYEVVAAGVSGDTSAAGVRRIDVARSGRRRFLILEWARMTPARPDRLRDEEEPDADHRARQGARREGRAGGDDYDGDDGARGDRYVREVGEMYEALAREHTSR